MGNAQSLAPVAKGRKGAHQFLINKITGRQNEQKQHQHQRNTGQNIGRTFGGLTDQVGFGYHHLLDIFIAAILVGCLGHLLLGIAQLVKRLAKIGKAQAQPLFDLRGFVDPARYRAAQSVNAGNHRCAEAKHNGQRSYAARNAKLRKRAHDRRKHKRQQKRHDHRQHKTLRHIKTAKAEDAKRSDDRNRPGPAIDQGAGHHVRAGG